MEKNDKEKLLIDDIRSLFEQIKEEEKGRYQPGTGFMKKLLPSNICPNCRGTNRQGV